jgi:ribosomal protein S18 acetylase RimI-like enzyme
MPQSIQIRQLTDLSSLDLDPLLETSKHEGSSIVTRLVEEFASGVNRFDRPGEALFGAFIGSLLVGVSGLNIDPYLNQPWTGRVRHLYILPDFRRRGIASELVGRVIEAAQGTFTRLTLYTNNPHADLLYQSLGFCTTTDQQYVTHIMSLATLPELRSSAA